MEDPPVGDGGDAQEDSEKKEAAGSKVRVVEDPSSSDTTKQKALPSPPFLLGDGLAPVPSKLVEKIQRLEFVDLADLLRDNLEVQRRSVATESTQSTRNKRREITDLLSWVSCFGAYAAVLTAKYPGLSKQLWAYQTMIVREARRCGGNGWLAYDSYFRQQVAGNSSADWSHLNTSLYAVTFLAQGGKTGVNCSTCMGSDHTQQDCALFHLQSRTQPTLKRPRPPSPEFKRRAPTPCCFAWNKGECRYSRCRYRHSCLHCGRDHPACRCPSAREDREGRPSRDPKSSRQEPKT